MATEIVGPFDDKVWQILKECGTLRIGHFVFTAGDHSNSYVDKVEATDDSIARKKLAFLLENAIIKHLPGFIKEGTIVGTPMGAISLATTLSDITDCQLAFLEKKARLVKDENEVITGIEYYLALRGANLKRVKGRKVFLIEDVITSGKTTTEALDVLRANGADIVGMSCIANRKGWTPPEWMEVFVQLAVKPPDIEIVSWPPEECPLCDELIDTMGEAGTPINIDCGHGEDFLAAITDENRRKVLAGKHLLG